MIILTRGYGQTDRPTNRPTDIATYRAAIAAKKGNFCVTLFLPGLKTSWGPEFILSVA